MLKCNAAAPIACLAGLKNQELTLICYDVKLRLCLQRPPPCSPINSTAMKTWRIAGESVGLDLHLTQNRVRFISIHAIRRQDRSIVRSDSGTRSFEQRIALCSSLPRLPFEAEMTAGTEDSNLQATRCEAICFNRPTTEPISFGPRPLSSFFHANCDIRRLYRHLEPCDALVARMRLPRRPLHFTTVRKCVYEEEDLPLYRNRVG